MLAGCLMVLLRPQIKIEPNKQSCRGLETYKHICNVKLARGKLMEDIRADRSY